MIEDKMIMGNSNSRSSSTEGLRELKEKLKNRSFFSLSRDETLHLLDRAFGPEIDYLKSAYVSYHPGSSNCTSRKPSQVLFNKDGFGEVNRTLTGVLSLQWIYKKDYATFTKHQNPKMRMKESTFEKLHKFFSESTNKFRDYERLYVLIILQITNDLGKSEELKKALEEQRGSENISNNHDVLMSQALETDLIPSFQYLTLDQREIVAKHIQLSAHFNPGQLVQAECPPAALDILTDPRFGKDELTLKFLEYFLDLAGAKGHINWEGAEMLIEPVFNSFWRACELTTKVAINHKDMSSRLAYNTVLADRIDLLRKAGWTPATSFDIRHNATAYAKARIFCMGRAVSKEMAARYNTIFDQLPEDVQTNLKIGLKNNGELSRPAVLPTYMPQMILIAGAAERSDEAIAAVLTYMSRVLVLSETDLEQLQDTVIVERDVRVVLEDLLKSSAFLANPASVVNTSIPDLPETEVFQKADFMIVERRSTDIPIRENSD